MNYARTLSQVSVPVAVLASAVTMVALIAVVVLNIPNPNIVLMAGLVVCVLQ